MPDVVFRNEGKTLCKLICVVDPCCKFIANNRSYSISWKQYGGIVVMHENVGFLSTVNHAIFYWFVQKHVRKYTQVLFDHNVSIYIRVFDLWETTKPSSPNYFEINKIYLFDHLLSALIKHWRNMGGTCAYPTGYPKSDLKIRFCCTATKWGDYWERDCLNRLLQSNWNSTPGCSLCV